MLGAPSRTDEINELIKLRKGWRGITCNTPTILCWHRPKPRRARPRLASGVSPLQFLHGSFAGEPRRRRLMRPVMTSCCTVTADRKYSIGLAVGTIAVKTVRCSLIHPMRLWPQAFDRLATVIGTGESPVIPTLDFMTASGRIGGVTGEV